MVINTVKRRQKRTNFFMTKDEVMTLWHTCQKHWSSKFQLMLGFALFRGLRVGEICAINLLDFNDDYSKLRVITSKTYVDDWFPLIPELQDMVKVYVAKNKHRLKDGYLFPFYSSKQKAPHMTVGVAESFFSKLRKQAGLVEKVTSRQFRVGFHSCRRYFETTFDDKRHNRKELRDIMRYFLTNTVDTYLDPYTTWKNESEILRGVFDEQLRELRGINTPDQMRLTNFINKQNGGI